MFAALATLLPWLAAMLLTPGDHERTIQVGGRARSYIVHVPQKVDGKTRAPVVLAYHGGGSNAMQMVRFCGLNEMADREGFLAVYPNGSGPNETFLTWNAGNCCAYAMRQNIDDVAFTRALLDDLAAAAKIDERRIFATGMSNGGMMAYRLAAEMSERIAAIAPVAGPMGLDSCRPQRPVSVLYFHGTADEFAPLAGGRGRKSASQTNFRSVAESLRMWVEANGCPAKPNLTTTDAGGLIHKSVWGPGKSGSEVVFYEIEGGGHTWPGRTPPLKFLGPSTVAISANDLMWEFFMRHLR